GVAFATSADWEGYLVIGAVLAWGLLRTYVLPRSWSPPVPLRAWSQWWALATALSLATAVLWVGLFQHGGGLADWFASGEARGGGEMTSLSQVLEARRFWIEFSFTPLAILLGKAAVPVAVLRLALRRRDEEVYSLAMLFTAVFHYAVFKRAA